jgi:hypothetical protein
MKKLYLVLLLGSQLSAQTADWSSVEAVFGRKGTTQGDVFKVPFPRSDLKVKVGDVSVEPALALTSWVAFKRTGEHSMVMGDLVLLDSEVSPVVSKLVAQNVEVTAIHNHIVGESPAVKYLHFGGHGDPTRLAQAMMSVLSVTATPLSSLPSVPPSVGQDWTKVESILGWTGQRKGMVLQVTVPRSETITDNGMDVPPFMGMATALNIQMVGEKAATTGDFVLLAGEVNLVVKALTESGITVTAVHNHMLFESPRLFFLHFWGFDTPEKLATGLRAALDKTSSLKKK